VIEVRVEDKIAKPAANVWKLIGGFNDLTNWAPGVNKSELEGQGVGAVRTLTLAQGGTIKEKLEAHDPAGMSYSYTIVSGPLPVSNYHSTLRVIADGAAACKVEWSSRFEPAGSFPAEKVTKIIDSMYRGGIAAMKTKLGG